MPAKSRSCRLGPLTGGRDVLVLNLSTRHTERITTHFYKHMKHHWYTCCSQYVLTCSHIRVYLRAFTCSMSFHPFMCLQDVRSEMWSGQSSSPAHPPAPFPAALQGLLNQTEASLSSCQFKQNEMGATSEAVFNHFYTWETFLSFKASAGI